jgi:hypothetical protein
MSYQLDPISERLRTLPPLDPNDGRECTVDVLRRTMSERVFQETLKKHGASVHGADLLFNLACMKENKEERKKLIDELAKMGFWGTHT